MRVRDGETLLTDGIAAEIKEVFAGRRADAAQAYRAALRLGMSAPEHAFVKRRLAALT